MKPMLASDWNENSLFFPLVAQPKIDGVRSLNIDGQLVGRSLKKHKNVYVTRQFSVQELAGFDGEMAAQSEVHPDLCRLTTSVLGTIEREAFVMWHLFDYVTEQTKDEPYETRLLILREMVHNLEQRRHPLAVHLRVVPSMLCHDINQLLSLDAMWVAAGYEGTIIRDPKQKHKQGRSTAKERGLLRIKRFVDGEAIVERVVEGETNLNEAKINELGLTERSTHQENMLPNGMAGTLICRAMNDITAGDRVVIAKGDAITVSAGKLTADERKLYFEQPNLIEGRVVKYKFFPKGMKDKLRFATFQSFREASDIGTEEQA